MRYYCTKCGDSFYEEDGLVEVNEVHMELDGHPSERLVYLYCPNCGADENDLERERENV